MASTLQTDILKCCDALSRGLLHEICQYLSQTDLRVSICSSQHFKTLPNETKALIRGYLNVADLFAGRELRADCRIFFSNAIHLTVEVEHFDCFKFLLQSFTADTPLSLQNSQILRSIVLNQRLAYLSWLADEAPVDIEFSVTDSQLVHRLIRDGNLSALQWLFSRTAVAGTHSQLQSLFDDFRQTATLSEEPRIADWLTQTQKGLEDSSSPF